MTAPFVYTLSQQRAQKLRSFLEEQGFLFSSAPHTLFIAKKPGLSLALYQSLKLTVQGKQASEFIQYALEPFLGDFAYSIPKIQTIIPHIGTDEAGKGDFFGPLVVAGVYVDGQLGEQLRLLGVQDSKKLSDKKILSIAPKITELCPNYIISLLPKKYNELYTKFHNLNRLLAWCHATIIDRLASFTKCSEILVDQFAHESLIERCLQQKGKNYHVVQKTKAESDIAVAAASCVARLCFLQGMDSLSKDMKMTLPKGSSSPTVIEIAQKIVDQFGLDQLQTVTKTHFKITKELCYDDSK